MKTYLSLFWTRRSPKSSQVARTTTSRPNAFAMDVLEDRRLAAVDVYYDDGIRGGGPDHPELRGVHIIGTDRADRIEVTHQDGLLKVWAARPTGTGLVSVFNADDVPRIFFDGRGGNDVYTSNSSIETIAHGGAGDDDINGGWGRVELYGDGGNDTLHGGNMAYGVMFGGSGDDELRAGARGMELFGDEGNDLLVGGYGDDYLFGGDGDDDLFGREGQDSLEGSDGNDQLSGGSGDDNLFGQDGVDVLFGDRGLDWMDAGPGNDLLYGGEDALVDRVIGGSGSDVFQCEWRFDNGYIQYFEDDIFDFVREEGDRLFYSDFKRLVAEYSGMRLADILEAGGGTAGFAAPEDSLAADDALASASWLESDPMESMEADLSLYVEPMDAAFDPAGVDLEVSILEGEEVFHEPIDEAAGLSVLDELIADEPSLSDLAIIDAAFTDYFTAPSLSPINVVQSVQTRISFRWF